MKYLLWALVIYLAWRWFSASRDRQSRQASSEGPDENARSGEAAERMVKCPECGLHLPLSEALPGPGEQFFCSESHRDKRRAS